MPTRAESGAHPAQRDGLKRLDVRPLLARGEDPLTTILSAIDSLGPGGVLEITAPFRPLPLLRLLSERGHSVTDREIAPGHWSVTVIAGGPRKITESHEIKSPVSSGMAMEGLRPEQGPPLVIPLSFFLTAPLALILAGALLAFTEAEPFSSRWVPMTMAITHIGTIGFLGAIMLGALYQMIPVVAGSPVPWVRLAHFVHAGLLAGLGALAWGLATGDRLALWTVLPLLGAALAGFWLPAAIALARAPTRSHTVTGMRLALVGLAGVAIAGLVMAHGKLDLASALAGSRSRWFAAHVAFGLVVWVGGLITSVSWQVIPMFYIAPPVPRWCRTVILLSIAAAIVLIPAALGMRAKAVWIAAAAAPAATAIWLLHPIVTWQALSARRRRRADGSLLFWRAGLICAPLVLAAALGTSLFYDSRWAVAFGWIAVWGWAGLIVHGMLTRIVPFLVWFHRYAPLLGRAPVPSMRQLLPESAARRGLGLHLATLIGGAAAIVTGWTPLAQLTGLGLAATGAALGASLIGTLRRPAMANPQQDKS